MLILVFLVLLSFLLPPLLFPLLLHSCLLLLRHNGHPTNPLPRFIPFLPILRPPLILLRFFHSLSNLWILSYHLLLLPSFNPHNYYSSSCLFSESLHFRHLYLSPFLFLHFPQWRIQDFASGGQIS